MAMRDRNARGDQPARGNRTFSLARTYTHIGEGKRERGNLLHIYIAIHAHTAVHGRVLKRQETPGSPTRSKGPSGRRVYRKGRKERRKKDDHVRFSRSARAAPFAKRLSKLLDGCIHT